MESFLKINASKNILSALDAHTRVQISQIDRSTYFTAIHNGSIKLHDYAHLLERLYGFFKPIEEKYSQCRDWAFYQINLSNRQKLPLLNKDLQYLGHSQGQINSLALCPSLPNMRDFSEQWGVMYALENLSLRYAHHNAHLINKLPLYPSKGISFFEAYGNSRNSMWSLFQDHLNLYVSINPEHKESILESARLTLLRLEQWLKY